MIMATYKVLQDIEAEDKLVGPLSLRQFIYGAIAAVCLYLSYFLATKGAAFMIVPFLPVAIVSGFFAFPWGRDQPTEVWALAKIRFLFKPRRRIWDQSGAKEQVTITAPKHIDINYTNNLSQEEVHSRLHALAATLDTRGWAVKNVNLNSFSPAGDSFTSDRLVSPAALPKPVDDTDILASDDIMDEQNNANAQRLQVMIDKNAQDHRDHLIKSLNAEAPAGPQGSQPTNNYWFLNQMAAPANVPNGMVTFNTQVVAPVVPGGSVASAAGGQDDAKILADLEEQKHKSQLGTYNGHMHTIQPISDQHTTPAPTPTPMAPPAAATPPQNASAPVTPAPQAAILQLASNNDLNVATLAREAERAAPQDEVVIKLH
jgi:hypothetical protein